MVFKQPIGKMSYSYIATGKCQSITKEKKGAVGECKFPWIYGNKFQVGCAGKGSDKYLQLGWCSHDVIYDGNWGLCGKTC